MFFCILITIKCDEMLMNFALKCISFLHSVLQAKRQLGHKTYQKVATFMCHDANTAKRFYQGFLKNLNQCQIFFLVVSINLYSFYPFRCTAEDPAEVTLQSRGLSMMAISTYAAKKRKRGEKRQHHDHCFFRGRKGGQRTCRK